MQNKEVIDIRNNDDGLFYLRTRSCRVPGSWHAEIFGRMA